jgi:hypothetical protein
MNASFLNLFMKKFTRAPRADHLRERFLRDPAGHDVSDQACRTAPPAAGCASRFSLELDIVHTPVSVLGKQTARVRHSTRLSSVLLAAALATSASCRRRVADCTPLRAGEPVH